MDFMKALVNIGLALGGLAGVALSLLYFLQEKIIYVPAIPGIPRQPTIYPDTFGLDYEDIWLTTPDNIKLNAWIMWPRRWTPSYIKERPVLVFFQENAGNMAFRLPFLESLTRILDCSAFILSYRGYGHSEGTPSEAGIQKDAETAIKHLLSRTDIDPSKIIVFGRSLGGAVAIYTATKYKDSIRGMLIENTFSNLEEVAPHTLPLLRPLVGPGKPCNFLLRNKWYNDRRVPHLTDMPILFLSSLADEMLHPSQMEALYLSHGKLPWRFVPFEGARHMDCYETHAAMYWTAVKEFVESLFPELENSSDGGNTMNGDM